MVSRSAFAVLNLQLAKQNPCLTLPYSEVKNVNGLPGFCRTHGGAM